MKKFWKPVAGGILFLFLFIISTDYQLRAYRDSLAWGFVSFVQRNAPEWTINFSGLSMFALCGTLAYGLLHHLGKKWISNGRFQWRARHTGSMLLCLIVLFVITLSTAGLLHSWRELLSFNGPRWVEKEHIIIVIKQAQSAAEQALLETKSQWTPDLHARVASYVHPAERLQKKIQIVFVPGPSNQVTGYCLIPRDQKTRERMGFYSSFSGTPDGMLPISELSHHLSGTFKDPK
jgi:hypothetical protein